MYDDAEVGVYDNCVIMAAEEIILQELLQELMWGLLSSYSSWPLSSPSLQAIVCQSYTDPKVPRTLWKQ